MMTGLARPSMRAVALTGVAAVLALSTPVLGATSSYLRLSVREGRVYAAVQVDGRVVNVPIPLRPEQVAGARLHARVGDVGRRGEASVRVLPKSVRTTDAASDDMAAQYPAGLSPKPGTIVTVAGGYCDGQRATAATISPRRLTTDAHGRVFWVDDDSSYITGADNEFGVTSQQTNASLPFFVRHLRGSFLVRHVDAGRVRTLGPVIGPEAGWHARTDVTKQQFQQVAVTPQGRVFVNVNTVDVPYQSGRLVPGAPLVATVQEILPGGQHRVVVGGQPYRPDVDRFDPNYGENDRVSLTALASVQSMATDMLGNLFIADSSRIGDVRPGRVKIRYANLGNSPVTFYTGTPDEVTVDAGRIRTVAGHRNTSPTDYAGLGADITGAEEPGQVRARDARLSLVPTMVVRGGVLYVQDDRAPGLIGTYGRMSNIQIKAVNLGLSAGPPRNLNGVPIATGSLATIVGAPGGSSNSNPDPGPALAAQFGADLYNFLGGFAVSRDGDIAIADPFGSRVRVVDALGVIRTVVGVGVDGDGPDGALASDAYLHRPESVTFDASGRLLIADYFNARIRSVGPDGRLRTWAGRGPTPCGEGGLATGRTVYGGAYFGALRAVTANSKGDTFVADASYSQVRRISPTGQVDAVVGLPTPCVGTDEFDGALCGLLGSSPPQPASSSQPMSDVQLSQPMFLAPDSYGNLYISDIDRIRYVNFAATARSVHGIKVPPRSVVTVRSFAGRSVRIRGDRGSGIGSSGAVPFDHTALIPVGDITIDGKGNLFIADPPTGRIYRLDLCGNYTVVAGSGQAAYPDGGGGQRDDSTARVAYGEGKRATDANVVPRGLAYDRQRDALLVLDPGWPADCACAFGGERIRAINFGSRPVTVIGVPIAPGHIDGIAALRSGGVFGDGGPARDASMHTFSTLAVDPDGRIYFGEAWHNTVRVVLPDGRIGTVAGPWEGSGPGLPAPLISPESYDGDGKPALGAGFTLMARQSDWNKLVYGQAFVGMAPNGGGLLVADMTSGRVRKILDPAHAPIRFGDGGSSRLPQLPGDVLINQFGPDSDLPRVEGQAHGRRRGVSSVPGRPGEFYATAANESGAGCAVFRLRRRPNLTFDIDVLPVPQPAVPTGSTLAGGSCRLAARVAGTTATIVSATPVQLSDVICDPAGGGTTCDPRIVGIAVSVSSDQGETWRQSYVPLPDAAPANAGGAPELIAYGSGFRLVYLDAVHSAHVWASSDGLVWLPGQTVASGISELGRPVVRGSKLLIPTLAGSTGIAASVGLLETSDGTSWRSSTAAPVAAGLGSGLTPPAAAVAADGTVLLTWSDNRSVFVAARGQQTWSKPLRLPGGRVSVLPGIGVAQNGTVAVAYATTTARTATSPDSASPWFALVARAVLHGGNLAFADRSLLSPTPLAVGPLCFAKECTWRINSRDLLPALQVEDRALTVLRVYRPASGSAFVTATTSCAGFLGRGGQGCVRAGRVPPGPEAPAPPARTDGVPTVTEAGLAGCSPIPPLEPAAPHAAPVSMSAPAPAAPAPPVIGVAAFPGAPPPPAPIPGPALLPQMGPAPASQVNPGSQQVQQLQSGHQMGAALGVDEEEQQQTAAEYAFSWLGSYVALGLGAFAVLGMASAVERQRRAQTTTAPVAVSRSARKS